ncbi:hypothetical protein SNEBB_002496 [Seison nebaliae]|nr:hypothetical protein SNEBB_002496 [Seison nebaliae]
MAALFNIDGLLSKPDDNPNNNNNHNKNIDSSTSTINSSESSPTSNLSYNQLGDELPISSDVKNINYTPPKPIISQKTLLDLIQKNSLNNSANNIVGNENNNKSNNNQTGNIDNSFLHQENDTMTVNSRNFNRPLDVWTNYMKMATNQRIDQAPINTQHYEQQEHQQQQHQQQQLLQQNMTLAAMMFNPLMLSNNANNLTFNDLESTATLLLQAYKRPKRARTAFTPSQLIKLEKAFESNHYVVGHERRDLAKMLNLSETQVKVWFQNRRTKCKRQLPEDEEWTNESELTKLSTSKVIDEVPNEKNDGSSSNDFGSRKRKYSSSNNNESNICKESRLDNSGKQNISTIPRNDNDILKNEKIKDNLFKMILMNMKNQSE